MADQLNRLGLRGKWSKEEAADTARACEAIIKSERALGQVPVLAWPPTCGKGPRLRR